MDLNIKKIAAPDWREWIKKDAWTMREAILLLGINPEFTDVERMACFRSIEDNVVRSFAVGTFPTLNNSPLERYYPRSKRPNKINPFTKRYENDEPYSYIPATNQLYNIIPVNFLIWAESKGYVIPDPLRIIVGEENDENGIINKADVRRIHILFLKSEGKSHKEIASIVYNDRPFSRVEALISRDLAIAKERYLTGKAVLKDRKFLKDD